MNKDFIVAIAIARGIGQTPLLGGMTVHFDDTWVWQFRKAEDRIHIVRRNVRFRATKGRRRRRRSTSPIPTAYSSVCRLPR